MKKALAAILLSLVCAVPAIADQAPINHPKVVHPKAVHPRAVHPKAVHPKNPYLKHGKLKKQHKHHLHL
jgi:hypothetical protein